MLSTDLESAQHFSVVPQGLVALNPITFKTYFVLLDHRADRLSVESVAEMVGVSKRTAWRAIKELRDAGHIVTRSGTGGESNDYFFPTYVPPVAHCATPGTDGLCAKNTHLPGQTRNLYQPSTPLPECATLTHW